MLLCRYDYLKITNDTKLSSGKYCGNKNGKKVEVIGDYAFITFHSDSIVQRKGFQILFHIKDSGSNSTTIGIVSNHLSPMSQLVNADDTSVIEKLRHNSTLKANRNYIFARFLTKNNRSCAKMIVNLFPAH